MTKDVELHSSTWKTMQQALTGFTENSTISSSGYGNYTNVQAGAYSTGTASTGFAKRVEELVKISEKVQRLIAEKDTDGAVSYSYYDDTSIGQTLQSKSSKTFPNLNRVTVTSFSPISFSDGEKLNSF